MRLPSPLDDAIAYLQSNKEWPWPQVSGIIFNSVDAANMQIRAYFSRLQGMTFGEIAAQERITFRAAVKRARKIRNYLVWWIISDWPTDRDSRVRACAALIHQHQISEPQARWYMMLGNPPREQSDESIDSAILLMVDEGRSLSYMAQKIGLHKSSISRRWKKLRREVDT